MSAILHEDTKIQFTLKQFIAILISLGLVFAGMLWFNNKNFNDMKSKIDDIQFVTIPTIKEKLEFTNGQVMILINATSSKPPQLIIVSDPLNNTIPNE